MDESYLGDGRAGAGGLLRRGDGSWVTGFNGFLGIANNTYAELMTLFVGVKLPNNMGCNQVCCYSDSKTIIDIVTKPVNKYHCYASVIACFQKLLRIDWEV